MRTTLLILLACLPVAQAATITVTDSTGGAIPDGSATGIARNLTVSGSGQIVTTAELDLVVSSVAGPAFLGDLYFYVTNGTQLAVLANRAGRRAGVPAGYGDNQSFSVTFTGLAADDFHSYRVPVTGSNSIALSGPLTGMWQPDGRAVDPGSVLDTDARTAGLGIFAGVPADGTWSLFGADLSSGAVHRIDSWTLRLETVPEPAAASLGALAALAFTRRRRVS